MRPGTRGFGGCLFGGQLLTCTKLAIYVPAAPGPRGRHRGRRLPSVGKRSRQAARSSRQGPPKLDWPAATRPSSKDAANESWAAKGRADHRATRAATKAGRRAGAASRERGRARRRMKLAASPTSSARTTSRQRLDRSSSG